MNAWSGPAADVRLPGRRVSAATLAAHEARVTAVVGLLRQRVCNPPDLAEMADLAGVSRCHFDRIFRAVTCLSPRRFHAALRFNVAVRTLLLTDRSVTDVCFDVGYESLGTFVSTFTRTLGMSPNRLRQVRTALSVPIGEWVERVVPGTVAGLRVSGEVRCPQGFDGFAFIGLFKERLPTEQPRACAAARPGVYALNAPPGTYHVLALGLEPDRSALSILLDEQLLRAGGSVPLAVTAGRPNVAPILRLRPPGPLDPPINLFLPFLKATVCP